MDRFEGPISPSMAPELALLGVNVLRKRRRILSQPREWALGRNGVRELTGRSEYNLAGRLLERGGE